MPRTINRILIGLIVALFLIVGGLFALLRFGPVTIGSPGVALNSLLRGGIDTPDAKLIATRLKTAPGFTVNLYARDVARARWMRFTNAGDLIVSQTQAGKVIVLERDRNGDGSSDGRRVLLEGLDRPHGLEIHEGWLLIAEATRAGRIRFDEATGVVSGKYEPFISGFTGDGFHFTRTLRIGPDGLLYLSQGSTCNVCVEKDARRGTIMRFSPDGSDGRIYASGLRNSVGFDWAPWNGHLYATENGRDLLGDDSPPDELNDIHEGGFYGWPFVNGFGELDPDFGDRSQAARSLPPVHGFAAHNAPLGISFLRASTRPDGFERAAVVALHGSWNRSEPDGYKVVSLHWSGDQIEQRDFLTGFLGKDDVIGRPVDVTEGPDGAVYVSDDYAGAIYRVAPVHARTRGPG